MTDVAGRPSGGNLKREVKVSEAGSSVPRRQLGKLLRSAREKAGVTVEQSAKHLEVGRHKIYRMEKGEGPVRLIEARMLCELYAVDDDLTEVMIGLASETKSKGWWQPYGAVVPDWFDLYLGLEASASHLRHYAPALIPGLLQTEEYAEAMFRLKRGASDDEVHQNVELRMQRQQQLLRRRAPKPPRLEVLLDEAVLHRPIADRDAWQRQLAHLVNVQQRRDIELRVLPSTRGPHAASIAGEFVVLDFPRSDRTEPEPTTVYIENLAGALYLDQESEVNMYAGTWNEIGEQALDQGSSDDLIGNIIKEQS
jgi:DNA-binding XRE family transcriptional regulator